MSMHLHSKLAILCIMGSFTLSGSADGLVLLLVSSKLAWDSATLSCQLVSDNMQCTLLLMMCCCSVLALGMWLDSCELLNKYSGKLDYGANVTSGRQQQNCLSELW